MNMSMIKNLNVREMVLLIMFVRVVGCYQYYFQYQLFNYFFLVDIEVYCDLGKSGYDFIIGFVCDQVWFYEVQDWLVGRLMFGGKFWFVDFVKFGCKCD